MHDAVKWRGVKWGTEGKRCTGESVTEDIEGEVEEDIKWGIEGEVRGVIGGGDVELQWQVQPSQTGGRG